MTRLGKGDRMDWIKACSLNELTDNQPHVAAGVVLVKQDGKVFACGARCPHMGYPMAKGTVRKGVITCAWHKWEFDLEHGGCYRGACDDLPSYPAEVRDGVIHVAKPATESAAAREEVRLRDGLMQGDIYLQAKAIARLIDADVGVEKIVGVALDASFRHSIGAHQSVQATREASAIFNASRLARQLDSKRQVTMLLQGIRVASGPVGERPAVGILPQPWNHESLHERMEQYVADSSALGLERIFKTLYAAGTMPEDIAKAMLDLASRPWFAVDPDVFVAVVNALEVGLKTHRMELACAWVAWTLGESRPQADPDSKDAIQWLDAHRQELSALSEGHRDADLAAVSGLLEKNHLSGLFDEVFGWLQQGVSTETLINAISLACARRVDRLWLNNGGMWGDAVRGLRLCHAWRRSVAICDGPHRFQSLFLILYYLYESRWLQAGHAWVAGDAVEGDWDDYGSAFRSLDLKKARAISMRLLRQGGRAQAWPKWIGPLIEEDISSVQIEVLTAAIAESAYQDEWEPFLAGMITYIMNNKAGQDVLAAAKFGYQAP